jgi:hypothetical protein
MTWTPTWRDIAGGARNACRQKSSNQARSSSWLVLIQPAVLGPTFRCLGIFFARTGSPPKLSSLPLPIRKPLVHVLRLAVKYSELGTDRCGESGAFSHPIIGSLVLSRDYSCGDCGLGTCGSHPLSSLTGYETSAIMDGFRLFRSRTANMMI